MIIIRNLYRIIAISVLFFISSASADDGIWSFNKMGRGCAASQIAVPMDSAKGVILDMGACYGMAASIMYFDENLGLCIPKGVTSGQFVKIMLKYASDRPEVLHKPVQWIFVQAAKQAWPCPAPR